MTVSSPASGSRASAGEYVCADCVLPRFDELGERSLIHRLRREPEVVTLALGLLHRREGSEEQPLELLAGELRVDDAGLQADRRRDRRLVGASFA